MSRSPLAAPHTRREFCRKALSTGVGLSLAAAARPLAAKEFPQGHYVDVHTHLGRTWNSTELLTAENLLQWMDASQISQAVVLPLVSPESSSFPLTTDFVLEATAPHRERLIPFCSIDPRASVRDGIRGLVQILRDWADRGAKGFGEHKPGVRIDDPQNMTLYQACGEVGLPVLFHLDEQRNRDAPGLPGLEHALKGNPDTQFIGHGPGWWASISNHVTQADLAGYPDGPVEPGGAIDTLMEKYPHLHGDLSAGSGAGAITRDPTFGREFLIRRADRLMFGTDYLTPGQEVPQLTLFRTLDLPADVQAKIFRDNARKLLGIG